MKKLLPILFISVIAISCNEKVQLAGETIHKNISVENFTAVENKSSAAIELDSSINVGELSISGDEALVKNIEVENVNGELKIKNKEPISYRSNNKTVLIKMNNPDIEKMVISGAGSIATNDITLKKDIEFHISGAGEVNVKLFNNRTSIFVAGAGTIRLRGSSDQLKVKMTGAGNLEADELKNKWADVEISGAGNAKINTSNELNVKISGVGNLEYKNYDQLKVVKKISGIGTINPY